MNKGTVIRAGIIFGLFVIILGAAWVVSGVKDKNDEATLTDQNEAYLQVGDYTITRADLWTKMRLNDGVSYLTQYIERTYFYANEIKAVTDAEVTKKIEFYKYGTNDTEELAKIFDDAELKKDLEDQFVEGLLIINFDPTSQADLRRFVELEIAKENATKAYALAADEEDDLYITEDDLKDYYESNTKGDVCAINIKFNSVSEANNLFDHFNLVPNYNLGWGEYFGTETPIEDMSTGDFNEDNTRQLTDQEVFEYYVQMYNYMNPSETAIADDSLDTFCTSESDRFTFNYDDMTDGKDLGAPITLLAKYMFNTLDLEDDNSRYSFNLQGLGEFQILSFKVAQDEVAAFDTLTQTEKDAIEQEILDSYITNTIITRVNDTKWDSAEFEIFDPILKIKFQQAFGTSFDNNGSKEVVATINGNNITADMLFDYMEDKIGTYYTIDMIQTQMLLTSDAFTDLFGTSTDYINSKNETVSDYRDELRGMKTYFSQGQYAQYGFDNSVYSWDDFLLLAFGALSENEAIQALFILSDLQPYLVLDVVDYGTAATIIQNKVDKYFNLDVVHLLAYTDFDDDLSPDEFNDYVAGLTGEALTEYNSIKAGLEAAIEARIDDDKTFSEIVAEFNESLVGEDNDWADAKAYGFHLMTQDLSAKESLTAENTTGFDEDFVAAVKDLYDEYVVIVETSATEITELYDDELFQSDFGLHYLYATEGSAFDLPSAVYSESDDLKDDYPVEANGTTIIPSADQVALYIEIENAEKLGKATDASLPKSVYDAVDAYFGDVYSAYFSSGSYSIMAADYIINNNPTYTASDTAANVTYLNNVIEILYNATFPEGFIIPE